MANLSALVSVVVPVYNVQDCLERCISSIINQKYRNLECICVDDGSTDLSGSILDDFAARDTRVKVVHVQNGGVSRARNIGLGFAKGDYVAFVDSDDCIEKTFLSNALSDIKTQTTQIDVWIGQRRVIGDANSLEFIGNQPKPVPPLLTESPIGAFLRSEGRFYLYCVWGKLIRREVIAENGLRFLEGVSIGEDSLFMAQVYSCARHVRISGDCFGYLHSQRAGSLVRRHWADYVSESIAVVRELERFGKERDRLKTLSPLIAQWAMGRFSVMFHKGYSFEWMSRYINALCREARYKSVLLASVVRYGRVHFKIVALCLCVLPVFLNIEILKSAVGLSCVLRRRG